MRGKLCQRLSTPQRTGKRETEFILLCVVRSSAQRFKFHVSGFKFLFFRLSAHRSLLIKQKHPFVSFSPVKFSIFLQPNANNSPMSPLGAYLCIVNRSSAPRSSSLIGKHSVCHQNTFRPCSKYEACCLFLASAMESRNIYVTEGKSCP